MRYPRFFALVVVALLSTGCLRATYTLNLKPDGSGTIHQTLAMTGMALQQAAMMSGEPGSSPIPDENKMREAAAAMGPGVRFVSSQPYKQAGYDGVTAIYAFDDIRTLTLSMDKIFTGAMDSPIAEMAEKAPDSELKVAFDRSGNGATLTLTMPPVPEPTDEERARAAEAMKQSGMSEMPPEAQAMMKTLFNGLLLEVALNVEGTIVSTNAPYKEGNKIVLLQLDGTELLKGDFNMSEMMNMTNGGTVEDMLRKTPGVKMVTLPELKIQFR